MHAMVKTLKASMLRASIHGFDFFWQRGWLWHVGQFGQPEIYSLLPNHVKHFDLQQMVD